MSDRNNVQLAIGYGLGAGMVLAGVFVVAGQFIASVFNIDVGVFVVVGAIMVGGVIIAVYNALKLDRTAISTAEDPSE